MISSAQYLSGMSLSASTLFFASPIAALMKLIFHVVLIPIFLIYLRARLV